jgi:hypothetical protein
VSDWGVSVSVKSAAAGGGAGGAMTVNASEAVCVSEPEVPVNVTVPDPAAAPDAAVSVIVVAAPGVSVSVEGCATTPAGKPVIVIGTFAAKPFCAVASRDTDAGVPLAMSVVEAGVTLSEKSCGGGAGCTDREVCALTIWAPSVAVKLTMAVAAGAEEFALIATVNGTPGLSERLEGTIVTPVGKFETVTVAEPDPAWVVSSRDALWLAAPAVRLMLAGVTVSVGAGSLLLPLVLLPPQESRALAARALETTNRKRRILK